MSTVHAVDSGDEEEGEEEEEEGYLA